MDVHPSAVVHPAARLGRRARVGALSVVHADVDLGDDCVIEAHCEIGHPTDRAQGPLVVGAGALVRSFSVLYAGSTFGPGLRTGTHAVAREGIRCGARFQLGTRSEHQGHGTVGDDVRTQSGVFVCGGSALADGAWLLPHVVLTNDPHPPSHIEVGPTVEERAVICAGALVLPGLRIGAGSVVAAGALVTRDVLPGRLVVGQPARDVGPASDIVHRADGAPAYPWARHFGRGYPDEQLRRWRSGS